MLVPRYHGQREYLLIISVSCYCSTHAQHTYIHTSFQCMWTKKNVSHFAREDYKESGKEAVYGTYGPFMTPILMVNDPDIVKAITVKDCNHFAARATTLGAKNLSDAGSDQAWHKMLPFLTRNQWKYVR